MWIFQKETKVGERERKKHQYERNMDLLTPTHTLTGDQTLNFVMSPDQELNWKHLTLPPPSNPHSKHGMMLNQLARAKDKFQKQSFLKLIQCLQNFE